MFALGGCLSCAPKAWDRGAETNFTRDRGDMPALSLARSRGKSGRHPDCSGQERRNSDSPDIAAVPNPATGSGPDRRSSADFLRHRCYDPAGSSTFQATLLNRCRLALGSFFAAPWFAGPLRSTSVGSTSTWSAAACSRSPSPTWHYSPPRGCDPAAFSARAAYAPPFPFRYPSLPGSVCLPQYQPPAQSRPAGVGWLGRDQ
jgi:hypothetical protein